MCTIHYDCPTSSDMSLKAVFFDLDDTLVATSEIDTRAYDAIGKLASRMAPSVNVDRLLSDFKKELQAAPNDPNFVVDVTAWRASFWTYSLQKQMVSQAASLGPKLQVSGKDNLEVTH